MDKKIINLAIRKAKKTPCRYKIVALGFDRSGNYLGNTYNIPQVGDIYGKGRGRHAEVRLIKKYIKKGLSSIIIFRTNMAGKFLPIDCCIHCKKIINKLGLKVHSLGEEL
jgi:hypothetical protein